MSHITVAVVAAGAMGAAIARRLTYTGGFTVLTTLKGRSQATRSKAKDAGMTDVELEDIARRATLVLSILPPSDAMSFARLFADKLKLDIASNTGRSVVFADCNAVSPETVKEIHGIFSPFKNVSFIDAGIIGGPPNDNGYTPTVYASAPPGPRSEAALAEFKRTLEGGKVKVGLLQGEGADVGDASALKMGYAGINKGLTGLTSAMILAAYASSPATARALMEELSISQPALLQRTTRMVPDMLPKAYRFVGEMKEIQSFVDKGVPGGSSDIWGGLASLFQAVSDARESGGDQNAVRVLESFVDDAKQVLREKEEQANKSLS